MSSSETKSSPDVNSNQAKGRGRPPKKLQSPIASSTCTWCGENKTPLKYVLPTQTGKKEFCSETCIAEFRKAYNKGACRECDNVIRPNAPNKEFCSTYCLNKNKKKNGTAALASQHSSSKLSFNNNNLPTASNNNKESLGSSQSLGKGVKSLVEASSFKEHFAMNRTGQSPMFQYEHFQVFDWKDYLKVSLKFNVLIIIIDR